MRIMWANAFINHITQLTSEHKTSNTTKATAHVYACNGHEVTCMQRHPLVCHIQLLMWQEILNHRSIHQWVRSHMSPKRILPSSNASFYNPSVRETFGFGGPSWVLQPGEPLSYPSNFSPATSYRKSEVKVRCAWRCDCN